MRRGATRRGLLPLLVWALVGIALCALPAAASPFALRVLQTIYFGAGLAIAWNILGGFAGYWSFGHAAFLGVGAFTGALLQEHWQAGLPPQATFVICLLAGGGAAGLLALILGYPLLRLRGTYFAIAMLGVSLVLGELAANLDILEGAFGIVILPVSGAMRPELFFYYVFLAIAALSLAVSWRIRRSKLGYGLIAIREDEDTARMLGVPAEPYKIAAFVVSAVLTGLLGAAFAFSLGYITSPSVFRPDLSLDAIVYVLLGGMGTLLGPVVGAVAMTLLTQVALGGLLQIHTLVTGLVIILLVFVMPNGIVGLIPRRRRAPLAEGDTAPPVAPAEGAPADLRVSNLTMRFRGLVAIDDVSIGFAPGRISTIIGPNGAGKSTIFNMISGYLRPSAGEIRLDGARIDGMPTHRLAQKGIARAFQIARPFHGLDVFENALVGALFGRDGPRDAVAVTEDALRVAGLAGLAGERASSLPVGNLRKLELARVLAARPRLVLADEPCAGLNPTESQEMVAILEELRRRGATVLLVEHDMPIVMQVSSHIHVIAAGRLIAEGPPAAIARDQRVIDAYLGRSLDAGTPERAGAAGTEP